MPDWPWLALVPIVAHAAIAVGVTLVVIMRRRPLPVTLSWIAIAALLPYAGLMLYVLIGENRLGRSRLEAHRLTIERLIPWSIALWNERERAWIPEGDADEHAHIARFGTAICGLPPLMGNRLQLLGSCAEFTNALERDIDASVEHCHIQTFIWVPRLEGERAARALIRASQRGVECRVLVDAVGSSSFLASRLCTEMRRAGVEVVAALPVGVVRSLFRRIDLRNHRKIAVIDGRIAYCGSHNITDASFGTRGPRPVGPWIDASVRVVGPASEALQTVFLADWNAEAHGTIDDPATYLPLLDVDAGGTAIVQILPSGPGPEVGAIEQAMLTAIYSARSELVITTPYFIPGEAMLSALTACARRGVDVRIVVPARNDSMLVASASRSYYLDLLDAGVRIAHYTPALLHAKTMTIDRSISLIGSANLDRRSFTLNFEATLIAYDREFAALLRELQQSYLDQSDEVSRDDWQKRPLARRFLDNAAQLLSPIL